MKRLWRFVAVLVVVSLVGSNWFVHKPVEWRDTITVNWPGWLRYHIESFGNACADYTDALGISGSDATVALPVYKSPHPFAFAGEPRIVAGGPAPTDIVVLQREAFVVGWSPSLRHPVWVAYRIPPTDSPYKLARPSGFTMDRRAPNSPRSGDYTNSGYDRGHLVPNHAIASRFGKEAQRETFMMSNVAPQRPWLNQGPWADIERRAADDWPRRYGEVWVITGVVLSTNSPVAKLAGSINIPAAFYQIIAALHNERLRICAVVMPQQISRTARPRCYLASIAEVERLSGLDFFWALPDKEEAEIEAILPTRLWPSGLRGMAAIVKQRNGVYPASP